MACTAGYSSHRSCPSRPASLSPSSPRPPPARATPARWNIGPHLTGPTVHRAAQTRRQQHPAAPADSGGPVKFAAPEFSKSRLIRLGLRYEPRDRKSVVEGKGVDLGG